eukprot:TRINITY_DN796_c0_g2_i2.p1 TRINITY_DN796_c0_g2~~TRINITY_DN796_c0_g2_i2.p1  ORF type:complete len:158 (+),score=22.33 TRINITY_DN796_c0_g2_i2:80-553(+)
MDGAHQHAFWKQRVYKEERDRYLLQTRSHTPDSIPSPSKPIFSPSAFKPNQANPTIYADTDRHRLPPLRSPDSQGFSYEHNHNLHSRSASAGSRASLSRSSTSPTKAWTGRESKGFQYSSPHVPYRPRGPPASLHGVSGKYHTFTYQGQSFLENTKP